MNGQPAFRVAIADDHAVVRTGYRRLLELEDGIEVVAEFDDGDGACRWLAGNAADALILDLSMPGRGGLATLQHLHRRRPDLRVVVFTMHDDPAYAEQAFRLGAAGYLTKNSPPATLVDAIAALRDGRTRIDPPRPAMPSSTLPHACLSPREFEVFLMLADGSGVEEIARRQCLSAKTVANVRTAIRHKTGLANALQMHHYVREHALRPAAPALD